MKIRNSTNSFIIEFLLGYRNLSHIDHSIAVNDPQPFASFSALKNSQRNSSDYASGFSGPAVLHLVASSSPRHEGHVGQASSEDL